VVNGKPLLDYPGMTPEAPWMRLKPIVREKGGEIIAKKGATYYGVAMMLAKIVAGHFGKQRPGPASFRAIARGIRDQG
jgi:malate/lactate dehydrogenase